MLLVVQQGIRLPIRASKEMGTQRTSSRSRSSPSPWAAAAASSSLFLSPSLCVELWRARARAL